MSHSVREPSPIALFCPECRIQPDLDGGLDMDGLGRSLTCRDCHRFYPIIEGVPVLHPEVDSVLQNAQGAHSVTWPGDVDAWCASLATRTVDHPEYQGACLLSSYAVSHFPDALEEGFVLDSIADQASLAEQVQHILDTIALPDGPLLELGCGPGGLVDVWCANARGPVVLADCRLEFSRLAHILVRTGSARVPRHRFGNTFTPYVLRQSVHDDQSVFVTVADALNPPFPAEEFSLIAAMNLLDSVCEPWILLGQIDAMLQDGGYMVLSLPYQDQPTQRLAPGVGLGTPQDLLAVLDGQMPGLDQLNYEIIDCVEHVPWSVVSHDRLVHRFATQLVVARKRPAVAP